MGSGKDRALAASQAAGQERLFGRRLGAAAGGTTVAACRLHSSIPAAPAAPAAPSPAPGSALTSSMGATPGAGGSSTCPLAVGRPRLAAFPAAGASAPAGYARIS